MKTKTVSWLIAFLPLLSVCRSPIAGADLGTALTIVVFLLCLTSEKKIYIKKRDSMNLFLLYMFLTTVINTAFFDAMSNPGYANTATTIMRLGKFLVIVAVFFSLDFIRYIDADMTIDLISKIITVNTVFIIIQRLSFQLFGKFIGNPLSFIATNEAYNSSRYTMRIGTFIRPSGFFFEPSHYAQYCVIYLCYLLFSKKKIDMKKIIIVSVGIVTTGSGMGILMLLAIVTAYLLIRFYKNVISTVMYSVGAVTVVFLLQRSPFIRAILGRVFSDRGGYGGNAIDSRIGSGYNIFGHLNVFNKLFGFGYGRVPNNVYLNGAAYLLNTIGIIGSVWFIILLIRIMTKVPAWGRWTIVCYIVLLVGAQMFSPASLVYFIGVPIATLNSNKERAFDE